MDLILWRHAEARDARDSEDDLVRPLTQHGEKQAAKVADWLNRQLPQGTGVLVSPALRCLQTAEALDRNWRVSKRLAPGASVQAMLDEARWPDSREPVLLVGHQPALGQLAASLLTGAVALDAPPWAVRKGAVWWLRHRERSGRAQVVLVAVCSPDMF